MVLFERVAFRIALELRDGRAHGAVVHRLADIRARHQPHLPQLRIEDIPQRHQVRTALFELADSARSLDQVARDLSTFTLGEPTAAPLRKAFPDAVLVRESGLATPEDAQASLRAGFEAVLIGEALMRSPDPKGFLERVFADLRQETR